MSIATDDSRVRATAKKRLFKRDRDDWYVEEPSAVHALFDAERFSGACWDPCCGQGTIPTIGKAHGISTFIATDRVDRGYGAIADFLEGENLWLDMLPAKPANLIFNPPFNRSQAFVEKALTIATHKVAALNRLAWLEGQRRSDWLQATPLARIYAFPWRLNMPPGDHTGPRKGGAVAFAWMVWEHGWQGPPQLRWLTKPAATQPATQPPARAAG